MSSENVFRLFNTLTRAVEPIEPQEPGHLRFYACGPTVYSYAHIGNFRSFLTADLILRTARALGWETTYVTNITDVGHLTEDDVADATGEDKMAKALRSKEGEAFANIWDLARFYTDALLTDWRMLNLREPDVRPRATEHVRQQITAVAQLVDGGYAYETEQGVYFSVARFPGYGRLSGNEAAEALAEGAAATARDVVTDPEKRDPRDFALWKKDPRHLMQWYSPWGWGFPGWHIECSVMSMAYLGETIDLHAGGEDLIFPHHECEIAQSESLTGQPFARYWVHTRFLQVEGEKMSKRKGNFYTVRELIAPEAEGGRGIDPLALRLALLSGQYRKPFNFTFDNLKASLKHVQRFQEAVARVDAALQHPREAATEAEQAAEQQLETALREGYDATFAAMLDDLNTPKAISHTLAAANALLRYEDPQGLTAAAARTARTYLEQLNALLGVLWHEAETPAPAAGPEADPLAAQVEALLEARAAARKARDFARADAIRDELDAMGVEVMDTPEGTTWRRQTSV